MLVHPSHLDFGDPRQTLGSNRHQSSASCVVWYIRNCVPAFGPRCWLKGLHRTLGKKHRQKLAESARKLKVTIKKRRSDGSYAVSMA